MKATTIDTVSGIIPNSLEVLTFDQNITGKSGLGWMRKPNTIGPAKKWNALHWHHQNVDQNNTDSLSLSIFGVNNFNSQLHILRYYFSSSRDSILSLDCYQVDPSQFHPSKFELFYFDSINGTPAKMKKWLVMYDPAPELALNPKKGYYSSFRFTNHNRERLENSP